jgi:hypothetical protein
MGRQPTGPEEQVRKLRRQFPGWQIWIVPCQGGGPVWCARPSLLIRCENSEDLAATIRAAHNEVGPESVVLASLRSYAARIRRLRELEEAAGVAWLRRKAQKRRPARRRLAPSSRGIPPDVA